MSQVKKVQARVGFVPYATGLPATQTGAPCKSGNKPDINLTLTLTIQGESLKSWDESPNHPRRIKAGANPLTYRNQLPVL